MYSIDVLMANTLSLTIGIHKGGQRRRIQVPRTLDIGHLFARIGSRDDTFTPKGAPSLLLDRTTFYSKCPVLPFAPQNLTPILHLLT